MKRIYIIITGDFDESNQPTNSYVMNKSFADNLSANNYIKSLANKETSTVDDLKMTWEDDYAETFYSEDDRYTWYQVTSVPLPNIKESEN